MSRPVYPQNGRPFGRWIATAGLLVLGGLALARLPLDHLPRHSFPELRIQLTVGGGGQDGPAEVTRAWVREVESAARSLGRVRGLAGEVRGDGADLAVLFTPGTDLERKAARLESELAGLRRRLPAGSWLGISTADDNPEDALALVWLTGLRGEAGEEDTETAAEILRGVPGVRAVETYGAPQEEIRVELRRAAGGDPAALDLAAAIQSELARRLRVPRLGEARLGDRRQPLIPAPAAPESLAAVPIPVGTAAVPLGMIADVRSRWLPPAYTVRFNGEPARALLVHRGQDAPLLATDRALRERLADLPRLTGVGGGVQSALAYSEAEPLRLLLGRLGLGLLLASLAGAALGGFLGGWRGALSLAAAPAAAVAATANLYWLAGVPLHLTTLVALALGTAAVLPLAGLRWTGTFRHFAVTALTLVAAAALVPVIVGLAGGRLATLLAEPARAFLLAAAGSALAAALLPGGSSAPALHRRRLPGVGRRGPLGRLQRRALRDPGTALLLAATGALIVAVLCGAALVPRPGELRPQTSDLQVRFNLPPGSSLAETEHRLRRMEEHLAQAPEVERFWAFAQAGQAQVHAELHPRHRRPDRKARLATRLRYTLAALAAGEVETGARPGQGGGFTSDLEDRPEIDPEFQSYRVVLSSADFEALRAGYDRVINRLHNIDVRSHSIQGWGSPAVQRSLQPAAATAPADAAALAGWLRQRSTPPATLPLPRQPGRGERHLRVVVPGAPDDFQDPVPQEADLLGQPVRVAADSGGGRYLVPAAAFRVTEEVSYARVSRQSGRFVVPLRIDLPLSNEDVRRARLREIDRNLAQLDLPAACQLERPSLRRSFLPREQRPLFALALGLPLLLGALAACRLDSVVRAGATLLPGALGLLAAAPLIQSSLGQADELTLFALAAAFALALPFAAEAAAPFAQQDPSRGNRTSAARLYRGLRRQTVWMLGVLPGLLLGLAAPTLLGVDATRFRWALPLQAAAVAGAVALAAAALLVTPLRLAAARSRERDPEEIRRLRRPPVWSEPDRKPSLAVHSLVKIYPGRTGAKPFRALSGVTFELGPGITGLLGPNGAGKTTLLRTLTGLLEPTRGAVLFQGVPIAADNLAEYRRRIGFLPQEFNAYPGFTAEQFLEHWALEKGMPEMADAKPRRAEIDRLLHDVGLAEHAGRKVRDFSGGMRQRIGIARALLGSPPILIVDEPTTGLDVESRTRFRQILLETAGERIVLFSTHIASDVEAAAVRLLLLYRGQLIFDGTPEELTARARGRVFRTVVADTDLGALSHLYRVTARVRILEGIQVRAVARPGEDLAGDPVEPDLEEAYLAEIDRVDAAAGRERRRDDRFAFLDRRPGRHPAHAAE